MGTTKIKIGDLKLKITAAVDDAVVDKFRDTTGRAEHNLAQQMMKDTAPFVPARTERLSQSARVVGNQIIYPGPYARYLYYGKLMVDPSTGSSYAKKGSTKILTDKNLVFNKSMHAGAQSHWFEASKAQNLDKWLRVAAKAVEKYGK